MSQINKKQAQRELEELQKRVDSLTAIINAPEDVFEVTTYKEVCKRLGESQVILSDFGSLPSFFNKDKLIAQAKLQQIERFYNGDWKADWTNHSQYKYYPYFESNKVSGLGFYCVCYFCSSFSASPAYFKDDKIAEFVGRTYIDIYKDLI